MPMPVYDFYGYKLLEANYKNNSNNDNSYVKLQCSGKRVENSLYILNVRVAADFIKDCESYFIFEAAFKINDEKWFSALQSNQVNSIFFSVAFSFIREKIFSITTDIVPGLFIPILDLKSIDVSKEIVLRKK